MAPYRLCLVDDPCFEEHAPRRTHPERPERLAAIRDGLESLRGSFETARPRPATDEEILRIHRREHLDLLRSIEGTHASLDPDTYASPRSVDVARQAAGSAVDLARDVARGAGSTGFALVRPPGHHAERDRAMGFCLLNSVAIAAAALRAEEGVERIAIVDWDVHHGNGTQHAFETLRDVLFVSLHQFPFYPGTGDVAETGRDAGEGATVNLPLPAGCGDAEYGEVFESVVVPVLLEFRPEILLVSAGFDAHARDPLAGMNLSESAFACMAGRLRAVAEETCDGRLVLVLEGGYDLRALADSVAAVSAVLAAEETPRMTFPPTDPTLGGPAPRLRHAHSTRWRSLR